MKKKERKSLKTKNCQYNKQLIRMFDDENKTQK